VREVDEAGQAVVAEHDVPRLDVQVQDAVAVQEAQRAPELAAEHRHLRGRRQPAGGRQRVLDRPSRERLEDHGVPRLAVHAVGAHEVRVGEIAQELALAAQRLAHRGLGAAVGRSVLTTTGQARASSQAA
jgi:hypothetical protein